jgi:hypothetical protein
MELLLSLMLCFVGGVMIIGELRLHNRSVHPALLIFWIISPLIAIFSGFAVFAELLQRNHLEVYHEDEYGAAAGLLACLSCFGLNVILRPILNKLFPRLFAKVHPVYWVVAAYALPGIIVLIQIAVEGLPWDQRIPIP